VEGPRWQRPDAEGLSLADDAAGLGENASDAQWGLHMTTIFVAVPSYKRISGERARELCAADALTAAGHEVSVLVLGELALLDVARAELTANAVKHGDELILYQDDDVAVAGKSICAMVDIMKRRQDVEILSAPYRMRSEGNLFDVTPTSEPDADRLAECVWTGLGCVLCKRSAIDKLYAANQALKYPSFTVPGGFAVAIFSSIVTDAEEYDPRAKGQKMLLGDDRVFCHRLRQVGVLIHAYVDADTEHRGRKGNLGEQMREPTGLIGPDGRPLL
jgi:hypothetical protein